MTLLDRAKARYSQAKEAYSEQHKRVIEDLKFSNPSDPQQWDGAAHSTRQKAGRPCLTFDHTNQYIHQVVNDARQNKPGIQVVPSGSGSDKDVAEAVSGLIRHMEYQSRAGIAYDTAIESAARCGLGWLRMAPVVVDKKTNAQELRIIRVHDVLSVMLGPHTEPDGSDAPWGFVRERLTKAEFRRKYPGKALKSFDADDGLDEQILCVEYYEFEDEQSSSGSEDDAKGSAVEESDKAQTADEADDDADSDDEAVVDEETGRKVRWATLSGSAVLAETTFPGSLIPIVPVLGDEIWIEGKRYLSGMVRRMMDSQRSYNYLRSAEIEAIALQPKAPFLAASDAIEGHEDEWKNANAATDAYLPWNHVDDEGNPIPMPQRQMPPTFPASFATASQQAQADMQAGVGMYKSNLGAPSSATSGRAKRQDQIEGDTANFHYVDNLARSIEQLGRIAVGAIPIIYDTKRQAQILRENGETEEITVDPGMKQAKRMQAGKVTINPNVGTYGIRVKVGPAYTTLRQQASESLGEIISRSPQLLPIIGDVWARMQDFPEADKLAKRLLAMAPPQVQALEQQNSDIPPEVQAQMASMQQQMQQMQQQLQEAQKVIDGKQVEAQSAMAQVQVKAQVDQGSQHIDMFKAETERMNAQAQAQLQQRQADRDDFAMQLKMRELDLKEADMTFKAHATMAANQPEMTDPNTQMLDQMQKAADIDGTHADTQQTLIENERLLGTPIVDPNAQKPAAE